MLEYGRLPTTWEYYMDWMDKNIDLRYQKSIPCLFHNEQNGKSFAYDIERDRCSCFGRCKFTNADAIELHRRKNRFITREEAEDNLRSIYRAPAPKIKFLKIEKPFINREKVEYDSALQKCITFANTVDRWVELDQLMSEYPNDKLDLLALLRKWGVE